MELPWDVVASAAAANGTAFYNTKQKQIGMKGTRNTISSSILETSWWCIRSCCGEKFATLYSIYLGAVTRSNVKTTSGDFPDDAARPTNTTATIGELEDTIGSLRFPFLHDDFLCFINLANVTYSF